MARKVRRKPAQHVVPHPLGWAVKAEGAERASKVFPAKLDAVHYANQLATHQQTNLVVHNEDGTFRHNHDADKYGSSLATDVIASA